MENYSKNEKRIKGYLKNHISLDSSVVVKFLITGGIALSLTACGGGGGGSSSGGGSQPTNQVEKVKVDQVDKGVSLTGKTAEVDGKISGTKKDLIGITAKNSNVKSNANIELKGDNSVGIYATADQKQRAIFTVENDGSIKVTGKDATGILADNGVIAKNNGNISINSVKEKGEEVVEFDDYYAYVQKEIVSESIGMLGKGVGTQVINNKNIDINGSGLGILAKDGAKGVNNGTINVTSQMVDAVGYSKGVSDDNGNLSWMYKEAGKMYSKISGMAAFKNSMVENTEKGRVFLKGTGAGIEAAENSKAVNNGEIIVESSKEVWYETTNIGEPDSYEDPNYLFAKTVGMFAEKGSEIVNNKNIYVKNSGIGMFAEKNSKLINNGEIIVEGEKSNSTGYAENAGLYLFENSIGENNGTISVSGETENEGVVVDETSHFVNNGKIKVQSLNKHAYGISGNGTSGGSKIVNNGDIDIKYDFNLSEESGRFGDVAGISVKRDILNKGKITIDTVNSRAIGIASNDNGYGKIDLRTIDNGGSIVVDGKNSIGIQALNSFRGNSGYEKESLGKVKIYNNGNIYVSGSEKDGVSIGIDTYNMDKSTKGNVENSGKIYVENNEKAFGIIVEGNNAINTGEITVKGPGAGMVVASLDSTAINRGIINIDGNGSYGMYAGESATAINDEKGIINVGANAAGGMIADGSNSKVINRGTINIAKRDGLTEENKESIAVVAKNGGTIENTGIVNIDGDLKIGKSGSYIIGTTAEGKYGKISAKNIDIQGDLKISTEIAKNGYKQEYKLDNVIEAKNIDENIVALSDSLLYNAKIEKDSEGNYDAKLERNGKKIEEFAENEVKTTANILGKYFEEKNFATLSKDAKEVLNRIDISNVSKLNIDLKEITPNIYSNIGRELQSTTELFAIKDQRAIESIGENSFNFIFLGEHNKVDNRGEIEGYKSNTSGFIGAVDLGKGFYGTLGYGYNDLDYKNNGKGSIETIHLGVNKKGSFAELEYKFGVGGEYSFHNTKRDVFDRRAESNFNSYAIRGFAEIAKQYGKDLYIKPYLGLSLAYMENESFNESGAGALNAKIDSEEYTSIQPKLGLKIGKNIGNLNLFTLAEYSYELGNMDKNQEFTLEGFEGKGELEKDNLEKGRGKIKAGVGYDIGSVNISAAVGKEFGIDEDSFVELSVGYRF